MEMRLRELYRVLREQIRDHDAALEAMRALARATLPVSAVVLDIMIVGFGNLVVLANDSRLRGLAAGGRRRRGRGRGGLPWEARALSMLGATRLPARLP